MNKFLMSITLILALSMNAYVVGMQCAMRFPLQLKGKTKKLGNAFFKLSLDHPKADIKLLEYGREVEGASLLEQNEYFLPDAYANNKYIIALRQRLSNLSESIQDSLEKGFENSPFSQLSQDLQWRIIEGADNLFDIQYVNKHVLKAVKSICMKNFLMAFTIPQDKMVDFLHSRHVPIAFVNGPSGHKLAFDFCDVRVNFGDQFYNDSDRLKVEAFAKNVEAVEAKRFIQAWSGYEDKKQRLIVNEMGFYKAVMSGNSLIVSKDVEKKHVTYIHGAIQFIAKYPINNTVVFECLLNELEIKAKKIDQGELQLHPKDLKRYQNKFENTYALLYEADKYDNRSAFDKIAAADPYGVRAIVRQGSDTGKTFLDFVVIKGEFHPENIQKLCGYGYQQSATCKAVERCVVQ